MLKNCPDLTLTDKLGSIAGVVVSGGREIDMARPSTKPLKKFYRITLLWRDQAELFSVIIIALSLDQIDTAQPQVCQG
jgi:hypothetical protein